jgi:hypothetical protein
MPAAESWAAAPDDSSKFQTISEELVGGDWAFATAGRRRVNKSRHPQTSAILRIVSSFLAEIVFFENIGSMVASSVQRL